MPSEAKAIMMANGHCTSRWGKFIPPQQSIIDKKVKLQAQVFDAEKKLHPIKATKIIYATMSGTDLALYQLKESYDQLLEKYNIRPLLLDHRPLQAPQEVEIISAYWDRGFSCYVAGIVSKLQEGKWFFEDSIRFEKDADCNMKGGTSGAPITMVDSRLVIGINNTSNAGGRNCSSNNPCEIEGEEIIVRRGVRYGQQTYKIYSCITPDFTFDFKQPDCDLVR